MAAANANFGPQEAEATQNRIMAGVGEAIEPCNVTFNIIEADYESDGEQGMPALTGRDEGSDDDSDDETYADEPESESADELDTDDFVDEYEDENSGGA